MKYGQSGYMYRGDSGVGGGAVWGVGGVEEAAIVCVWCVCCVRVDSVQNMCVVYVCCLSYHC